MTACLLIAQTCGMVGVESLLGQGKPGQGIIWRSERTSSRSEQDARAWAAQQAGNTSALIDKGDDASDKGADVAAPNSSQHNYYASEGEDRVEFAERERFMAPLDWHRQPDSRAKALLFGDSGSDSGFDGGEEGGLLQPGHADAKALVFCEFQYHYHESVETFSYASLQGMQATWHNRTSRTLLSRSMAWMAALEQQIQQARLGAVKQLQLRLMTSLAMMCLLM
jgi:hypothetical protein